MYAIRSYYVRLSLEIGNPQPTAGRSVERYLGEHGGISQLGDAFPNIVDRLAVDNNAVQAGFNQGQRGSYNFV